MKKIALFLIVLAGLFSFASCDKDSDDPANHYSFEGKDYLIDTAVLYEYFGETDSGNPFSVFNFVFIGVHEQDTTGLFMTVYDTLTNTLAGNYEAIPILEIENLSRGIYSVESGILFSDESAYIVGDKGSIDVSSTDGNYTINFNDISAGAYNEESLAFTEKSKIGGLYKGKIVKLSGFGLKNASVNKQLQKSLFDRLKN